jgi:hypothetical protein
MGRLSSSTRRFRRPSRPGTFVNIFYSKQTRAMLARVSFSGTFRSTESTRYRVKDPLKRSYRVCCLVFGQIRRIPRSPL